MLTVSPEPSSSCKVCYQPAYAAHFGVLTCRACGAFFRRRVKEQSKLLSKSCELHCEKEMNIRKHCPTCRFKKCLQSGMKLPKSLEVSVVSQQLSSVFVPGPIFQSLHLGFKKLQNARKLTFGIDNKISESCTYTVQNAVVAMDYRLIMDNFISESEIFQSLKSSYKSKLLSQFIAPLHIIYGTYISTDPSHFYLANGDYIDIKSMMIFYKNAFDHQHRTAFSVFKPYWNLQNQIMRTCLDEVQLDLTEFLFLVALMLWDIDFHDCEEDLVLICIREKRRIIQELCNYEKHRLFNKEDDGSLRVGRVVRILHGVQKMLHLLYECFEVAQVYQLDSMHTSIRNSLRGPAVDDNLFTEC